MPKLSLAKAMADNEDFRSCPECTSISEDDVFGFTSLGDCVLRVSIPSIAQITDLSRSGSLLSLMADLKL